MTSYYDEDYPNPCRSITVPGARVREIPTFDRPMVPISDKEIDRILTEALKQLERPHQSEIDLSDAEWVR